MKTKVDCERHDMKECWHQAFGNKIKSNIEFECRPPLVCTAELLMQLLLRRMFAPPLCQIKMAKRRCLWMSFKYKWFQLRLFSDSIKFKENSFVWLQKAFPTRTKNWIIYTLSFKQAQYPRSWDHDQVLFFALSSLIDFGTQYNS
jgi:hypothetical protein